MQNFGRKLFLIFGLGTVVFQAHAEVCDWAKETPADDGQYKYFVAREFSTTSRAEALKNAENSITQQVCNIVGSYLSAASDSYEDENIANSASSTAQRSRCLGIYKQNFEKMKTDDGKIDGEYVACVKYKYAKENLQQEQMRISQEGTLSGSMALNEYIGNLECAGHPVEIKTNPSGALVSIDDKKEYNGITPLRFGNVCNGSHTVKITLNHYDLVEQKITNEDRQIFKNLKRSTKKVSFNTNLSGSQISVYDVDGFLLKSGKEPFSYDFLSGIEYKIQAQNPNANTVAINRAFDKNSPNSYSFKMDKLSSKIDFTVFKKRNPNVRIFVDGSEVVGDETGYLEPDKKHKITFRKSGGYKNKTDSIYLSPNETRSYPSNELNFETDGLFITKYDYLDEVSWWWVGGVYNMGSYNGDYISLPLNSIGVSSEMFFWDRFSFDLALTVGHSNANINTGNRNYSQYVQHTSAASLFNNYDAYADITIMQNYADMYAGFSWYFMRKFWFSPFASIGYNQFTNITTKINRFDTNLGTKEEFEERVKIKSGGIMGGIGVQMGVFRITGRYSPNYSDVSFGLVVPIKI